MPRRVLWEPASTDELSRFDKLIDTIVMTSTRYKENLHKMLAQKNATDVDDITKYVTALRAAITEIENLVQN